MTTPAETLVDLAAAVDETELARAFHAAGARNLWRVLRGEVKVTLSALERRFLDRLQQACLPLPQTNHRAGSKRVELDSYHSRHAWENDRRRERDAYARTTNSAATPTVT